MTTVREPLLEPVAILDLRPTQITVGMREVEAKRKEWRATKKGEKFLWFAEAVATFGLILTILGALRWKPDAMPAAVGLYIVSAYWFTASTSFANPAVTVARSVTDRHPPGWSASLCPRAACWCCFSLGFLPMAIHEIAQRGLRMDQRISGRGPKRPHCRDFHRHEILCELSEA